jgi:histidine ammonia-lyase
MSAREALDTLGLVPLVLEAKEGLALINGTQAMTAVAALVIQDAEQLATAADISASCSFAALRGNHSCLDARVFAVRAHFGASVVADNMRSLLSGCTSMSRAHAKVQDAYSLRCTPQVHGASRDALRHARSVIEKEVNSAIDNPLIFAEEQEVISAGNFHGQPVALVMDYVKVALAEMASISERRIAQLQDSSTSGLPSFLVRNSGLNTGLMISQYTAASLVSENKVLAHPASVDSIPTSANQEDHVSMGTIAARQAAEILANAIWVITIELINAAQAIEMCHDALPENGVKAALHAIRAVTPHLDNDQLLHEELRSLRNLLLSGSLRSTVERVSGPLQ